MIFTDENIERLVNEMRSACMDIGCSECRDAFDDSPCIKLMLFDLYDRWKDSGEWIPFTVKMSFGDVNFMRCSKCGKEHVLDSRKFNFCDNCGRRMKGML